VDGVTARDEKGAQVAIGGLPRALPPAIRCWINCWPRACATWMGGERAIGLNRSRRRARTRSKLSLSVNTRESAKPLRLPVFVKTVWATALPLQ
jgi:hypothetical protein